MTGEGEGEGEGGGGGGVRGRKEGDVAELQSPISNTETDQILTPLIIKNAGASASYSM